MRSGVSCPRPGALLLRSSRRAASLIAWSGRRPTLGATRLNRLSGAEPPGRRHRSRTLRRCLLSFGLAAETSHRRYRRWNWRRSYRNYRSGRGLWRRLLCHGSLLSRRRRLQPLLLARRGAAFCLLGFLRLRLSLRLRHVQPPDRFNQNYANDAGRASPP